MREGQDGSQVIGPSRQAVPRLMVMLLDDVPIRDLHLLSGLSRRPDPRFQTRRLKGA